MLLSDIIWGDDSAEKDPNLLEYFVSNSALNRLKNCNKSIIVGRKGSGKSAIRTKLANYFKSEGFIVVETAPNYNIMSNIASNKDITPNFDDEIFFQYIWLRHLLQSALIRIGDNEKGSLNVGSLEFARNLALQSGQTNKDLLESVIDVLSKVKVKAGKLGDLGLNIENVLKTITEVDTFEYHIKELSNSGYKFIFLVDDLDLGWNNSRTANNFLLGLLTTINYLKSISINIHPFIFIRDDVYRIILTQTQHSDKFRDIEMIKWNTENLKNLVDERIRFNFSKANTDVGTNPFIKVFPPSVGTSNTINWLVERTLGRPRELIQLSRIYTEHNESEYPNAELLKEVEITYSNWKLDDLCTEFKYQYPDLNSIFNFWKTKFYRNKYHLKRRDIEKIVNAVFAEACCNEEWFKKIKDNRNIDAFLKILYQIGFIGDFILGGEGGNKVIYSTSIDAHDPVFKEVQIHPCFRKAMGTVERIRRKKKDVEDV